MKIPFKKTNILIPKNVNMKKWSVIACDQYTSDNEYWEEVKQIVGEEPSTLNITLPEIYLEEDNVKDRIKKINKTMEDYMKKDIFQEYNDTMIYVEREQSDGRIREGLIGMIDLDDYSYEEGSETLIRATENTVVERIPPRVKVREKALLELPHIMILIDDDKKEIIESLKYEVSEKVYDFDLMQNGGHIKGYRVPDEVVKKVSDKLELLTDKEVFEYKYGVKDKEVLLFAIGDGNHSLATAKACYEKLKKKLPKEEYLKHPSRYVLVELVNLHSEALQFEAIHRVLFNVDEKEFIKGLNNFYNINENGIGQKITLVTNKEEKTYYIENPKSYVAVGSIQLFLDKYLKDHDTRIDYIHGEDTVRKLVNNTNNIGIILDPMRKEDLFKTVILNGPLPRKSFSMGNSDDKRFYLESRKIK